MADDGGYSYARPDVEEIDEPDPTFDVLTDYTVDLDNPLGVGGFGSVHFGCQRSTHKMVAVKAVSKARTRQAAERGAAHTSAEDILKMEIEVMRDLSETRHRNMCARRPPAARPQEAADARRLPAAAIPPPPPHRLPAAIPPPPPHRLPAAIPPPPTRPRVASLPAQSYPAHAPSHAPPHAHAAPHASPRRACTARSSTAAGRTTCTCTLSCSFARVASCRIGCCGGRSRRSTRSRPRPRSRTMCCRR